VFRGGWVWVGWGRWSKIHEDLCTLRNRTERSLI
jgi:hypothetical protein